MPVFGGAFPDEAGYLQVTWEQDGAYFTTEIRSVTALIGATRTLRADRRRAAASARRSSMTKVLILYYSAYGHMERMAQAVAEGVREAGAQVDIKRVPELVPEDVARKSGFKLDQAAPIATVSELADYDAIIFGSGTRFGVVTSQMRNFLDQTGPLWASGALMGKVGSVFTAPAAAWRPGIDDPDHVPTRCTMA